MRMDPALNNPITAKWATAIMTAMVTLTMIGIVMKTAIETMNVTKGLPLTMIGITMGIIT
jgi:hypothetical protein